MSSSLPSSLARLGFGDQSKSHGSGDEICVLYRAYRRLASLAASYKKAPTSLKGQILQGVVQGLDLRANAPGLTSHEEVPPPLEPLPWETNSKLMQRAVEVDAEKLKEAQDSQ